MPLTITLKIHQLLTVKLAESMSYIWNLLIQTSCRNTNRKEKDSNGWKKNVTKKKNKKERKEEIEIGKKKRKRREKENGKLILVLYLTVNNQYNNLAHHLRRRHKSFRFYKHQEKVLL